MLKNTWFVIGGPRRSSSPGSRSAAPAGTGPLRTRSRQAVFELRTYTAPDGKLGELHARFRNHTLRIFEKHGMTNVSTCRRRTRRTRRTS